jgi:hypothetical protein
MSENIQDGALALQGRVLKLVEGAQRLAAAGKDNSSQIHQLQSVKETYGLSLLGEPLVALITAAAQTHYGKIALGHLEKVEQRAALGWASPATLWNMDNCLRLAGGVEKAGIDPKRIEAARQAGRKIILMKYLQDLETDNARVLLLREAKLEKPEDSKNIPWLLDGIDHFATHVGPELNNADQDRLMAAYKTGTKLSVQWAVARLETLERNAAANLAENICDPKAAANAERARKVLRENVSRVANLARSGIKIDLGIEPERRRRLGRAPQEAPAGTE